MKFSIRELAGLTLLIALLIGSNNTRRRIQQSSVECATQVQQLRRLKSSLSYDHDRIDFFKFGLVNEFESAKQCMSRAQEHFARLSPESSSLLKNVPTKSTKQPSLFEGFED